MKRRNFLLRAGALAGAGIAANLATPLAWAAADPLFAKSFPDLSGNDVQLDQWLGKPLVVNFWATWCPPCVKEMPDLDQLHAKYSDIGFLGLAVDTAPNVEAFSKKVQVAYPLLLVGHAGIAMMRDMGNKAGGLPFTLVYNGKGERTQTILGQIDPVKLDQILAAMA